MDEPSDDSGNNIDDELIDQLEERRRKRREEGNRQGPTPRRKNAADGGSGGAGRRGTRTGTASPGGSASSGAFGLYGLRTGESVFIRVNAAEPGGYSVFIEQNKKHLPGYLPTQARLKTGERVLATFVCIHKNRGLLTTLQGDMLEDYLNPST